MSAYTDGLAHPSTAAEHAIEARRILARAEADVTDATVTGLGLQAALDSYPGKIAAAQVHATLALIPEPLEAAIGYPGVAQLGADGYERIGQRVIWMQERPGRRMLVTCHDLLGTIMPEPVGDDEALRNRIDDTARAIGSARRALWVRWDDGLGSQHWADELLEVLGG